MKHINDISIKRKLFYSYLIIVILPISIVGYFLTYELNNSSISNMHRLSSATSDQIKDNFINKLKTFKDVVEMLTNDPTLRKYIDTNYDDDFNAYTDYISSIRPLINKTRYNIDSGMSVRIFSTNRTIAFSSITNNLLDELSKEDWYNNLLKPTSNIIWSRSRKDKNGVKSDDIVCYRILMESYKLNRINAVISVHFEEKQLYSLISEESKGGKMIFLMDNNGYIITTTQRNLLFESSDLIKFNNNMGLSEVNDRSIVSYSGKKYLIYFRPIDHPDLNINKWRLIYMVPADILLQNNNRIWISSIILCLICISFSLIVIVLLSENITRRISKLIKEIKKIWSGDFKITGKISGKDEIGVLEADFYKMVNKIDTLINEVYKAEIDFQKAQKQKKEAELAALYGQINPHYLFNTLESVRMNLIKKNDRETANIIRVFAESFRVCIDSGNDFYTLREEIELVQNYFIIQKYRYGDKINLEIDIPGHIYASNVPKLILQPLVENAVYHGLEAKIGNGIIRIQGYEDDKGLHISVMDNGVGIEADKLDKIKMAIYGEYSTDMDRSTLALALKNVHGRLSLTYGSNYGLKISSNKGDDTVVELNLPVIRPEE